MYAGTHPQAKAARERRIEQAKRHENERKRRNLERMTRVADARALSDEVALQRLQAVMHEDNPQESVDELALYIAARVG